MGKIKELIVSLDKRIKYSFIALFGILVFGNITGALVSVEDSIIAYLLVVLLFLATYFEKFYYVAKFLILIILIELLQLPATDAGVFSQLVKNFLWGQFYKMISALLSFFIIIIIALTLKLALYKLTNHSNIVIISLFGVVSITNCILKMFRGFEFQWKDWTAITTAIKVAGEYNFKFTFDIFVVMLLLGWSVYFLLTMKKIHPARIKKSWGIVWVNVVAIILAWSILISSPGDKILGIEPFFLSSGGGFVGNLYVQAKTTKMSKPENYNEILEWLKNDYISDSITTSEQTPDIIVIMNETYTDLRRYFEANGKTLECNYDVYAKLDEIMNNSLSGNVDVSVFGGTTANSELEFLTGLSTAFRGDVPYSTMFNANDNFKSQPGAITQLLDAFNYTDIAMHPNDSDAWNRNVVYNKMNFDKKYFINKFNFTSNDIERSFMTDSCNYKNLLSFLNVNSGKNPLFLFNVTIQNHGGYGEEFDFEENVEIIGHENKFPQAEQYLSLINKANSAITDFLETLKEREKETIVLFFGDHGPKLESEFYSYVGDGENGINERELYQTPFFIWSNKGDIKGDVGDISLGYLQSLLLQKANMPQSGYHKFLTDLYELYPVISAHNVINSNGQTVNLQLELDQNKMLQGYNAIIYNMLEEKGKSMSEFYNCQ